MQDGVIDEGSARAAEVSRIVSFLPLNLPRLSSCSPFSSPLQPFADPTANHPSLQWTQGVSAAAAAAAEAAGPLPSGVSSLQLSACLELEATDKMQNNRLTPRKTLRNSRVCLSSAVSFCFVSTVSSLSVSL